MKLYYDQKIEQREFNPGDLVLLYNSWPLLFLGKIRSKWSGPFTIVEVFLHATFDMKRHDGVYFIVNDQ